MEIDKSDITPPNFARSIKTTALVILSFMAVRVIRKIFWGKSDFLALKDQLFKSDHKIWMIATIIQTFLVIWVVSSFVLGSLYHLILKVKFNQSSRK
ncbi:hypothetical protein GYN14_00105 [Lactococcus piscium]|jgi:hypothetical protein|uniref:hypothetical protein n=1 Tax=Pseudolactococcus carnosus TaxID=2749961 RepID=UPI000BE4640F|nr:hypothetical protein [Lactococcus carnosus]MBR6895505.1 hypothetical protein [Lactococcus sp.]MCJ1972920.1 hypothetical protein [Lactococcus carnosus]MCJ1974658.1 hypothetical protein [Lactococcus carnosus]MCJ1978713.1 hypothetical protein [Lactococcus carnosus]MCJ1980760.1 hypothetical protein [Lactococcus carnosus]